MGRRSVALFLGLLAIVDLAPSSASPSETSFTSELQERNLEESGLVQNMRTGHGGGDDGGSGSGGDSSSSSTTQQGRPLNGGGTANSRNHPHHGAGVHTSTCSFSIFIISITLALELFFFISASY